MSEEIVRIGKVYQKYMRKDVPIYVTGSVALYRALLSESPQTRSRWKYNDMDIFVPNTTKKNLPARINRAREACHMLNGNFTLTRYLSNDSNSSNMKDVLAKGKCSINHTEIPCISLVFSTQTIKHHLAGSKAPSNIAYPADKPSNFLTLNNSMLKHLRSGKITTPTNGKYDLSTLLKYSPRGFFYANGELQELKYVQPRNKKDIIAHSLEQQWRTGVTAKVHYETGAAWTNLHLVQGIFITTAGFITAVKMLNCHFAMRMSIICGTVLAGGWIAERPSERAKSHQVAGAKYSSLEREWILLLNRIKNGRLNLRIADAHAIYLQNKKEQLDIESPNAPNWWHKRIIKKLASKKYSPDP